MIILDARGKPVRYVARRAPAPPGGFALTLEREDTGKRHTVTFDGRGWRCTCEAFRFSRGRREDKHVQACRKLYEFMKEIA